MAIDVGNGDVEQPDRNPHGHRLQSHCERFPEQRPSALLPSHIAVELRSNARSAFRFEPSFSALARPRRSSGRLAI